MSQEADIILTPHGHKALSQRLDYLRNVQRREVADRIRDSKQFGDISENAEYEDAKSEQALVEGQIIELRRILQDASVLDPNDIPVDHIGIGSIVTLTNLGNDDEWEFTLVGSFEADPDNDLLSDESPVGRALLNKRVKDEVTIRTPEGMDKYRVDHIRK